MLKKIKTYCQYILPQHFLTLIMGWLGKSSYPRWKRYAINRFIKKYTIDMSLAIIEDPNQYENFNAFFTRQIKPNLRPIDQSTEMVVSPVDGKVAQLGQIKHQQLMQVKNSYFDLHHLLGKDQDLTNLFIDGSYATFYLAPWDYHRVHMPLAGKLRTSRFIPGKLFSVNRLTSEIIPNLYGRNERFVSIFDTAAGPMAVILVGAMLVGSIKMAWIDEPVRSCRANQMQTPGAFFEKGAELGYFQMGSTVIVLFGKNKIEWLSALQADASVLFGQAIGTISA